MSLQNITTSTKGGEGIKKEIRTNSIDIVFDILQVYAYSMPFESTIRELASNAVDAQREKEIAVAILNGEAKEEDFFIEKHGAEFEDSKFRKEYYDLKWLDTKNNDVELEYIEYPGSGFSDRFIVRDHGIGIGGGRLEGCIQLGFSTKRTTKEQIGGYGLGQKAALSTMTPFYTIVSAYNGCLFKLNIYSKKIEDVVGPINFDTGEDNEFITLSSGAKIYYEKTDKLNFTEISVPVKRLNKHKCIDAVESQLLYLPNIKFRIKDESGYSREHSFAADIVYNSENIIISNNSRFSRPHLIAVKDSSSNFGICYNEIDYKELELDQKYGKVALKVQLRAVGKDKDGNEYLINDGVTVTPNREQIIWNDDTKAYLLSITRKVTEEASKIVSDQLVEPDFLKWLTKCNSVLGSFRYGSILHELSQMLDKSNIKPVFPSDKSIKYGSPTDILWGLSVRYVRYERTYEKGGYINKIFRREIDRWSDFASKRVYFSEDGGANNIRDKYILATQLSKPIAGCSDIPIDDKCFLLIEPLDMTEKIKETIAKGKDDAEKDKISKALEKKVELRDKVVSLMKSSVMFNDYTSVIVPADFSTKAESEEKEIEDSVATSTKSLEELRKINGEIVYHTPRRDNRYDSENDYLVWDKKQEKTINIAGWTGEVYYGFNEDSEHLQAVCKILGERQVDWYNNDIRIIKIATKNEKHLKCVGRHISNFLYDFDKGCIKMNERLVKYYTARYVVQNIFDTDDFAFLKNYKLIDPRITKIYEDLEEYSTDYYSKMKIKYINGSDFEKELLDRLIKYQEFQEYVQENAGNSEEINKKSEELFGHSMVKDIKLLDMNIVRRVKLLQEYIEPVKDLFNKITYFSRPEHSDMPKQAENLIRHILSHLGLNKFNVPDEFLEEEKKEEEKLDS